MKKIVLMALFSCSVILHAVDQFEQTPSSDEQASENAVRLVIISDTHAHHRQLQLPKGDILIHAGDFTNYGKLTDIHEFNTWLGEQKNHFEKIYVVTGNHEHPNIVRQNMSSLLTNATFLHGDRVTFRGITIYGLGWAFKGEQWSWEKDTHIVITHQAPAGVMGGSVEQPGCIGIAQAIGTNPPLLHIFGHHHDEYGVQKIKIPSGQTITFANAALEARPKLHKPLVFDVLMTNGAVTGVEHVKTSVSRTYRRRFHRSCDMQWR